MFGGVSPDLDTEDIETLRDALIASHGGQDYAELAELVSNRHGEPLRVPYLDGEEFAAELLEDLSLDDTEAFVDIRAICRRLGIAVADAEFNTDSIRGAAIAGDALSPRIVINHTHPFNDNESGQRFTIAHEFCHVLFDRTRARRVAHTSGRWANPGIEQRANAFAAYLLMPRQLVHSQIRDGGPTDAGQLQRMATVLQVNEAALVEHLYNLDLISDATRVLLSQRTRST